MTMPELPEVETICRILANGTPENPAIVGKVIRRAEVLWHKTLAHPTHDTFQSNIIGQLIGGISRRGKYLIFTLDYHYLLFHLRMSGDLLVESIDSPSDPHHRLILYLDEDAKLSFNDTRKFGRVWLVDDPQEILSTLGPEPLDQEFTPEVFHHRLTGRQRQIKPLLMDQKFLAGLGNIYTDETLHMARIHPLTKSDQLSIDDSFSLWKSLRQVLQDGIEHNGASIDWVYKGGEFQNHFRVYQRTGLPCPECGGEIERITVGQRGTHICPSCQVRVA